MVASVIRPCLRRRVAALSLPAASAPPMAAHSTDITAAASKPPALRTIIFVSTEINARQTRRQSPAPAQTHTRRNDVTVPTLRASSCTCHGTSRRLNPQTGQSAL